MFDDEQELVSGYADFQRASMAIGMGSAVGGKYSKIEQILRAQALTPAQKFMEAAHLICWTDEIPFDSDAYEKISSKYRYPQYLNPRLCVFVVTSILKGNSDIDFEKVKAKRKVADQSDSMSFHPLDVYRYATLISSLLKRR